MYVSECAYVCLCSSSTNWQKLHAIWIELPTHCIDIGANRWWCGNKAKRKQNRKKVHKQISDNHPVQIQLLLHIDNNSNHVWRIASDYYLVLLLISSLKVISGNGKFCKHVMMTRILNPQFEQMTWNLWWRDCIILFLYKFKRYSYART